MCSIQKHVFFENFISTIPHALIHYKYIFLLTTIIYVILNY